MKALKILDHPFLHHSFTKCVLPQPPGFLSFHKLPFGILKYELFSDLLRPASPVVDHEFQHLQSLCAVRLEVFELGLVNQSHPAVVNSLTFASFRFNPELLFLEFSLRLLLSF